MVGATRAQVLLYRIFRIFFVSGVWNLKFGSIPRERQAMKSTLTLLLALLTLGLAAQSTGTIKGRILDDTGTPLPFANVFIFQGTVDIGTSTALDGKFTLKPVPSGTFNVQVTSVGYHDLTISGVEVSGERLAVIPDQNLTSDVQVIKKGADIVTLARPLIRPDQPSMKSLLASEIKHSPAAKNTAELVGTMSSDIIVQQEGERTELYFRGSRQGNNIYFLDGMKITGSLPSVPSAGIARMDVYTGGVPAKYGDFTGGVVVIETKSYNEVWRKLEARRLAREAMQEDQTLEQ